MVSELELANLCSSIYSEPSIFDQVLEVRKICIGIKNYPEGVAVIARGSYTFLDWIRDLEAIALINTGDIGMVPFGFYFGLPEVMAAIQPHIEGKKVWLAGHSLGAAHAAQMAGKLIVKGIKPEKLVLFGCPTPGSEKLRYLLSGTTIVSYKNLKDPVTLVPHFPTLVHVRDFTALSVAPAKPDPWGIFADHHMQYYIAGIKALFPPAEQTHA